MFNYNDPGSVLSSKEDVSEAQGGPPTRFETISSQLNSARNQTHTQGFDIKSTMNNETVMKKGFRATQGSLFSTSKPYDISSLENTDKYISVNPRLHAPSKFVINKLSLPPNVKSLQIHQQKTAVTSSTRQSSITRNGNLTANISRQE